MANDRDMLISKLQNEILELRSLNMWYKEEHERIGAIFKTWEQTLNEYREKIATLEGDKENLALELQKTKMGGGDESDLKRTVDGLKSRIAAREDEIKRLDAYYKRVLKDQEVKNALFNEIIITGEATLTLVMERLGCDDEQANQYLDGLEAWLDKRQKKDIKVRITRGRFRHYDNMEGIEFEQFCADLLKKNGFSGLEETSCGGDHGVDILAEKDGVTYAIQCKRLSANVGNKAVQEIYSGKDFYKRHVGVVLTNQNFTANAKEAAERTGIVLWDRAQLNKFIYAAREKGTGLE